CRFEVLCPVRLRNGFFTEFFSCTQTPGRSGDMFRRITDAENNWMLKTLINTAHGRSRVRPTVVFTIGHSTRSIETFIEMLKAHGARRLVDVRTIPRSRHNPQFNRDALPETLFQAGI